MSEDRKVAIITGSSQGLGAAIAKKLSERNVNTVINYSSNEDLANHTMEECIKNGVNAITVKANVSNDDDCIKLVKETINAFGKVDILVNNAGKTKFNAHHNLEGLSSDDFIDLYSTNTVGPYQMIKYAKDHLMKAESPSIVNIASIAGVMGIGSSVAYAASKGALNTMTLSLAKALGPEIRVNTVCPGFIGTGWFENRFGKETYERIKKDQEKITPLNKAGTPNDIADSAVFFCLEGSEHITGETLISDAGMHLNLPKG